MLFAQRGTCQSCNVVTQLSKLLKAQPSPRGIFLGRYQFPKTLSFSLKLPLVWSVPLLPQAPLLFTLSPAPFMSHPSSVSRAVCHYSWDRGKQQQQGHSCPSACVILRKPPLHLNCPWRKEQRCNYLDSGRPHVNWCHTATFTLKHHFQEIDFSE